MSRNGSETTATIISKTSPIVKAYATRARIRASRSIAGAYPLTMMSRQVMVIRAMPAAAFFRSWGLGAREDDAYAEKNVGKKP